MDLERPVCRGLLVNLRDRAMVADIEEVRRGEKTLCIQ
jgi:hypothetical protein